MVMENQEMVMEKSWENNLSSMWDPCIITTVFLKVLTTYINLNNGGIPFLFLLVFGCW